MKVAIVYIFPNILLKKYEPLAKRFTQSYMDFPPGEHDHTLHVVCNGVMANDRQKKLFSPLPVEFHFHNNYGKDIGAYMAASVEVKCDLMCCFGSHAHFHRPGWLDRIVQAYNRTGPGFFGCWGLSLPSPHIRTTIFWTAPELLSSYPHSVANPYRYEFEHGAKNSMLQWVRGMDLPVGMVTWTGLHLFPKFKPIGPTESLIWDQHIDRQFGKG